MKDRVCLECGSFIPKGKVRVNRDEDKDSVFFECPVCLEMNQTATLQQLCEFQSFKDKVMDYRRRNEK